MRVATRMNTGEIGNSHLFRQLIASLPRYSQRKKVTVPNFW